MSNFRYNYTLLSLYKNLLAAIYILSKIKIKVLDRNQNFTESTTGLYHEPDYFISPSYLKLPPPSRVPNQNII